MDKHLPVKNPRISQEYGRVNPVYRKGYHSGLDMVADENDKGIENINSGAVLKTGYDAKGWGKYVIVRQVDEHDVLYGHLYQAYAKEGQRVGIGDSIGVQGSTGNSTGPHLHLEIWAGSWEDRNDINPAEYLGIKNTVGPVEFLKSQHYEEIEVEVNGVIIKGHIPKGESDSYVQVKDLAEKLGGIKGWDETTRRASLDIFSNNELKAKLHTAKGKALELIKILEG